MELQDLIASMAALRERVQRLEDEREVTRLATRYGFAVDLGDADATAALYTADTEIDVGPGSQFRGTEGVRSLVTGERHQAILGRCAHTLGPLSVRVDGDRAVATGYVRVYVADPDGDEAKLWRMSFTRLELVREESGWRIARRTSRTLGSERAPELLRAGL